MITICKDIKFSLYSKYNRKIMTEIDFLIAVGHRIKGLRVVKNVSQQDLAAACNFEKSNMSRIEAGRTNLTLKNLYKIAKALDVEVFEIVDINSCSSITENK